MVRPFYDHLLLLPHLSFFLIHSGGEQTVSVLSEHSDTHTSFFFKQTAVATNLKPQTPTIQHLLALSRCRPALHSTECQLFPGRTGRMFLTFQVPMSPIFLINTQAL